ncbi:MAG TPA: ATP-binding protein, partial [Thermoanaerobaculia bacterium]|nr:ATP-binding protein [Thermoanaerobaculia bacterium]
MTLLKRSPLAKVHGQLHALQSEAATLSHPEKFIAELEELQSRLAELEVAYEELETQNEELLSTREALENQRHRYLRLFDEAPFGYVVTDLQGVVEEANQAASALVGIAPEHLAGKPLFLYLMPQDRRGFRDLVAQARTGELPGEREVRIKPRAGKPSAAVLTVLRDVDDRSRADRLRWVLRDVSQTRAMEEALRSSEERLRHAQRVEAIGRLAGGIAHSFNNLLAAIAFQCELLDERLDEGDGRRVHLEEIREAEERAAALASQLLAFGRRQVLQPRVLRLNELIREMQPMLQRLIGEHIRLETRLDPADGALHVDLGQLEQVILNLVVNARDAMPEGGSLLLATENVEITETEARTELAEEGGATLPPGSYLKLTVADTGIGITPEAREHLFEPFFTTKERGQGTGLGLATVHGIVHQSGGRIHVESEPGQGSRFTILLPRAAEAPEALRKPAGRPARRSRGGSEVVLLVEDETNIREPAVEILEGRGYRVLAARDAAQALALAREHPGPIHILVTDVIMPGLSGSQLAAQLSALRPEMRVLYISGYPEDSIAHHGVLDPEQHFLQKPFPPGRFLEK